MGIIAVWSRVKDWNLEAQELVSDIIRFMRCCIVKLQYCIFPPFRIIFLKLNAQVQNKVPYSFRVIVPVVYCEPYFSGAGNSCDNIVFNEAVSII